jgi:2-C-methyl-D-erythritol 2,4-cyclodiphosphate synthase
MNQRFGIGYDCHRFGAKRPLVLGGVELLHDTGLIGHSDGDAVVHAIIDALLGATAMGDIGRLYPDTDDRWKDANSLDLLRDVSRRLLEAGFSIVNIDVTVVTERPRLAPFVGRMRDAVSETLEISAGRVSIKAKTNEEMDAVGQGEGLQVFAVASVGSE